MRPYYRRGGITLYNADCFDLLAKLRKGGGVGCLVTDPPYGTTQLPWDKAPDLARWWEAVNGVLPATGIAAVFCQQPFSTDVIVANRKAWRYEIVWEKAVPVGFLDANRRPLRAHELVEIFARRFAGSTYNVQKVPGRPYGVKSGIARHYGKHHSTRTANLGDRHPRSVMKFAAPKRLDGHRTEKPLALVEWLVKAYTQPGDLVLDCYVGGGTTPVACVRSDRRFVGCELDEEICEKAARRIDAAIDGDATLELHHLARRALAA